MKESFGKFNFTTIPMMKFETFFEKETTKLWFRSNWHYSVHISIIYLFFIFSMQKFMKNHKALQLKKPLIMWNMALALYSIASTIRFIPVLIQVIYKLGFTYSVCISEPLAEVFPHAIFWTVLFAISKLIELCDTVFIVLRKRKLIFLHWFHHVVTFIVTWYSTKSLVGVITWLITMNCFVHSLMYTYYAITSYGIKLPRYVAMFVTCIQTLQMITAIFVVVWATLSKWSGYECDIHDTAITVYFVVYVMYFYLFIQLFYNSYISNSSIKFKKF
ncbi:putative fatty acid elongation protein 4 [Centruroides sculpturatus]|uniref:putative fatty acid elongation protein 4 n=1 Tax=Centruroides sculpturatus TaxID=218467 RepID=UPI000C6D6B9C|nr:putative fatty acid elongation protein 4 [Centruroides sculpturatus]